MNGVYRGQEYVHPWVDGFDNTAGVPFVPIGWWELASGHELGRRSRLRSSGGVRPVQLVAVRVEDTSYRARRVHPADCRHPHKQGLTLTWRCLDCGRSWPR